MCGISGFLHYSQLARNWQKELARMSESLNYRGPDDEGQWGDEEKGIAMAHKRLSILDLSREGRQPMSSPSGRYVISYNGEVYNFLDIRKELNDRNIRWRGKSDTEVILAAFDTWGVEKSVQKFIGMFAFALWDRKEDSLYLCRDRLGIKPLHYARTKQGILFASELKAFKATDLFDSEIDRNSLGEFLRYSCVPAPRTIFKNTWKLEPGQILKVIRAVNTSELRMESSKFWDIGEVAARGLEAQFDGPDSVAVGTLETLLVDAVRKRMIADVPVGVFLSGGIDSSTVAALMQSISSCKVKTFSIGTHDVDYNEADHARQIAEYLHTDHTELYVEPEDILKIIPELPLIYDEPFADSSQIPTYLVSKLARESVTVCLSGDGGDEVFGGYNRHYYIPWILRRFENIPGTAKKLIARLLFKVSPAAWARIFSSFNQFLSEERKIKRSADNVHKLAGILDLEAPLQMYQTLRSHWTGLSDVVVGVSDIRISPDGNVLEKLASCDLSHLIMFFDTFSYLPDDILTKVDRASMSVSLEARVPLLDHRVVEYAWGLPVEMKIRGKEQKWILKQVLYKYIPKDFVNRPKSGFAVPMDSWLRGPLRDWAESLLDAKKMENDGYLNSRPVREKWEEHLSGKRNWQHHLWDILMFQAWLEQESLH